MIFLLVAQITILDFRKKFYFPDPSAAQKANLGYIHQNFSSYTCDQVSFGHVIRAYY